MEIAFGFLFCFTSKLLSNLNENTAENCLTLKFKYFFSGLMQVHMMLIH